MWPTSRIEPLEMELSPEASNVKVRIRNYSEEQRTFLRSMTTKICDVGLVYPNDTDLWVSEPFIVPKPGPAKFCFTVYLRMVNHITLPNHYPISRIETKLPKIARSKFFANFGLSHGYWKL